MKKRAITFTILSLLIATGTMLGAETGGKMAVEDQEFVTTAAQGGMAEVKLSELAKEKGESPEVKELANMMVTDHTKANADLTKLATGKGFSVPADTDAKHKSAMDKLAKLSGAEFDKAYLVQMNKDHKKTVSDFEKASKTLKDGELKGFAEKTLPTLRGHLEHVMKVEGTKGMKDGSEKKATS